MHTINGSTKTQTMKVHNLSTNVASISSQFCVSQAVQLEPKCPSSNARTRDACQHVQVKTMWQARVRMQEQ